MARPQNLQARDSILGAAYELIYERGYKGISMDEVAAKAGMRKSNLFHYYPTKAELGVAVLKRAVGAFREHILRQLSNGSDALDTVERMFSENAAAMEKKCCSKGCFIGNLAQEISDDNDEMRREIAGLLRFWVEQLGAFLERHRTAGYFRRELSAGQAAQAIVALLEGATLVCKADRRADALRSAGAMASGYLKALRA
jgi:TetR/AcrR family transcriptional repressor of nem operon